MVEAHVQIGLHSQQGFVGSQEINHGLVICDIDLVEQQVKALVESVLPLKQILEAGDELSLSILGMSGGSVTAYGHPAVAYLHIETSEEECFVIEHGLVALEQIGPVLLCVCSIPAGAGCIGQKVLEAAGEVSLRTQELLVTGYECVVFCGGGGDCMQQVLKLEEKLGLIM